MKKWTLINNHHLEKEILFQTYADALEFTLKVGKLAEQLNHHPTLILEYKKVTIRIFTHTLNTVGPLDYTFSKQCDELLR